MEDNNLNLKHPKVALLTIEQNEAYYFGEDGKIYKLNKQNQRLDKVTGDEYKTIISKYVENKKKTSHIATKDER